MQFSLLLTVLSAVTKLVAGGVSNTSETSQYQKDVALLPNIKSAMLASIRTSWEQGTAAGGILEIDQPEYSVFGSSPFKYNGVLPVSPLQLALSAAVRQAPDGRLSQVINDGADEAALDGASAGSTVLMGTFTEPSNKAYWQNAADAQLNYLLTQVPRTSTGALSHRADSKQYWADGVYMGPPFLAYYGAVSQNQSLLQMAYDNCRLYRDALLLDGPTGPLWAHIYSDDNQTFVDSGLWASGNGWAALGMIRVAVTIQNTQFASGMKQQTNDLISWVKEILDGTFRAVNSVGLIPDYITGGTNFGDASASAALASVAYRAATLYPDVFGRNYTDQAAKIRDAVLSGVTELGVMSPVVDPLQWGVVGILSTEAQSFALMMFAAWGKWLGV